MKKIYLYFDETKLTPHGSVGYAFNDEGCVIHSHFSTDKTWSKHDLGLTSNWGHDEYNKHYPEGFELEWIDNHGHPILEMSREKAKSNATENS